MTDQELQNAIDKAREFMNLSSTPGGILYQARENTRLALKELEKIQVTRAAMAYAPPLTKEQP
jgi:hypothetical protein